MSEVEQIVLELCDIENTLNDWAERMISAIDAESTGARAERASAVVRLCVKYCRTLFAAIHREFERGTDA